MSQDWTTAPATPSRPPALAAWTPCRELYPGESPARLAKPACGWQSAHGYASQPCKKRGLRQLILFRQVLFDTV